MKYIYNWVSLITLFFLYIFSEYQQNLQEKTSCKLCRLTQSMSKEILFNLYIINI